MLNAACRPVVPLRLYLCVRLPVLPGLNTGLVNVRLLVVIRHRIVHCTRPKPANTGRPLGTYLSLVFKYLIENFAKGRAPLLLRNLHIGR